MIQKGQLLLAQPHLTIDRDFGKSAVLITEVNTEGVVGFILNKPLDVQFSDVVALQANKLTLFNGGPVESENLYFIHSMPESIEGGIPISKERFWGGSFEQVMYLLKQNELHKTKIQFFMGYSGWTYEQLESEIAENNWIIITEFVLDELLKASPKVMWKTLLAKQGSHFQEWLNTPDDPRLN